MGKRIKPQEYVIYLSKDSDSEAGTRNIKSGASIRKNQKKQKRMSSKQVREMIKKKEKRHE